MKTTTNLLNEMHDQIKAWDRQIAHLEEARQEVFKRIETLIFGEEPNEEESITVELTKKELATLYVALGEITPEDVREASRDYEGIEVLGDSYPLYKRLGELL